MIKQYKKMIIITSLLILVPMIAGILLWNQLPDKMATHWGISGEVDGYSSKAFTVFGLPAFLFAVHWVCILGTGADPKKSVIGKKPMELVLCICPLCSFLCSGLSYSHALGYEFNVTMIMSLFMGIVFIVIGNYLPKSGRNYTMGIKIPWTLNSDENWIKTHRFAGRLWVVSGIVTIITAFLNMTVLMVVLLFVCGIVPVVYSYIYYKKYEETK